MVFNSYIFLIYLGAVLLLYFSVPHRFRWGVLLAVSYYFYWCWKPEYVFILAGATLVDYVIARRMGKTGPGRRRIWLLILSLFLNVGTLFLFKYLNFFSQSLNAVLAEFNIMANLPTFDWLLPVGISYYTFKKISYIIDVYRENQKPEPHLGKFALFVSFFPTLIAGPIDRASDLLPQFSQEIRFDPEQIIHGLKLFTWGLFKKVVIADRLVVLVNHVYGTPADFPGITLALATLMFTIQIYTDFSGYTDMAIGIGQVLGFRLTDNFNRPYSSKTLTDFWRRWHMSFTSWLRDYIFLPVAYAVSRKVKTDRLLNIKNETWAYVAGTMVTMLLCGLWHGSAWTFLLWGGLHGVIMVLSYATRKIRKKWRKKLVKRTFKNVYSYVRVFLTFSIVSLLWVFFKANSIPDAFYIISRIFTPSEWNISYKAEWLEKNIFLGEPGKIYYLILGALGLMWLVQRLQPHDGIREMFADRSTALRWALYIIIVLAIMNLGQIKEIPFIYAEF